MQAIIKISLVSVLAAFIACNGSEKSGSLNDKKNKLAALKKEVSALETEISTLDTAAVNQATGKLVVTAELAAQTFNHYIDLQGKIESESVSYVTARGGGGQVKGVFVKRGDVVPKGKLLLKLDDAIQRQALIAAEQGLQTLKTQLSFANTLLQKQKNLWEQNIGTEVQLISAKNNVELLENQLKTAQEQVKISREQVQFTSVYSDVDGVAEEVNVRVGELFAGPGQIKIVNTNKLKVTAEVPENYSQRVKTGTKLTINLPDLQKSIAANISVVGKIINPNSRSFFIEAKVAADKELRPNQIALVQILDYSNSNAIAIPVNTLQNDETGKYVMVAVAEKGKLIARKRMVTVGEFYKDQLEIKSGLQAGDQIVTEGFQSLYDGQLIVLASK
jgi:membrane fusion protein (multidrug efflux system)